MKTMLRKFKTVYQLLNDTVRVCISGNIVTQGAALSYYTIFAIAPLFVIALAIAGFCFGEEAARRELFGQLNQLVGKEGGDAIQAMVTAAGKSKDGIWATCIAGGTLAVAATGVFVQLQNSLNQLWNVRYARGMGLQNFIRHRLLSFAMVFGIGFLLLVSLVCSAGLAALGNFIGDYVSGKEIFLKVLNFVISLGIITALFAMIFKFLPDVKIAWRDVWLGGFITAALFNFGKYLIGIYVGRSSISSVYGAMGSLVVVLMWVFYSAQILFFGAQFTCLYVNRFSIKAKPVHGAEFVPSEIKRHAKAVSK
jgi:membrane protein